MKNFCHLLFIGIFLSGLIVVQAQENSAVRLPILGASQTKSADSSQIKNIQSFDGVSGIAYTNDALYRTDDQGATWREIALPNGGGENIGAVQFENAARGAAVLVSRSNGYAYFAVTTDGGATWTKTPLKLERRDALEADLENASIESANGQTTVAFRLPTGSNFSGNVFYESADAGQTWTFARRTSEIRRDDAQPNLTSGGWTLKIGGECSAGKSGCVTETKVFAGETEITPGAIRELARREKAQAASDAQTGAFTAPGGTTRISTNRGFDKCTAAPISQMQTWWDNSPFYDVNIYMSGRNRGCTQAQLTAAWVNQAVAMGWGLIPTIVGYQSPCTASTTSAKFSYDVAVAEQQGRGEADIAITDAANLGLLQGTVLYYDMERYDETTATAGCRVATNAFLKGWTDRVKESGYISGVYGSPFNAQADWINLPAASKMDVVWLARWNNVMSVYGVAPLPDTYWTNHQRIHQWLGPRNETWGGVTFNIDNDISDAPVAGLTIAKNKPADFDGDGKTDISVFRTETGSWYILNSSTAAFKTVTFGGGSDVLAPADYDGDGKTDTAVFRAAEGNWYILAKAGTFSSRNFGQAGDIPVPADYNGDGKADIAVFRPSNGTWYIVNTGSTETVSAVQFGQQGDKPVAADYDGDGKTDVAVFRPSTGDWFVSRSSDGAFSGVKFGQNGDQPTPGDYDGDGKTDFAVFRGGTWLFLKTTAGFSSVSFGTNGDVPLTGDYDGDGKFDAAVYRPSNGTWYLLQSQRGFGAYAFGATADKPIPSAYLGQ